MNLAAEILVIILSVSLTVFLVVGIILTIYLINLTRQIRKISMSAERVADDFSSMVSKVVRVVSPMLAAEAIAKFLKRFNRDKEEK